MSYFPTISIDKYLDGPGIDAFGRLKVSMPYTQFESKQLDGNVLESTNFVSKSVTGGTASHSSDRASSLLSVTAASGSRYIRQSRNSFDYQPGKGLDISNTFIFGTGSAGIIKRVGYFNDSNGIFLEQSGTNINFVVRSSATGIVTEDRVSQSAWNKNNFNTNVSSSFILDVTKAQLFSTDIQWLGVGVVKCGLLSPMGEMIFGHHFQHINTTNIVYMSSPNLPVRTEIENYTGGSAGSMEVICCSVQSDAGTPSPVSQRRSADRGITGKAVTGTTRKPILSIKMASGSQSQIVNPAELSIFATTADNYRWAVYLNPTYSSTDSPVWQSITGSNVMFDMARDGTVSGGILLDSGYAGTGAQAITIVDENFPNDFKMGFSVDGVSDEIVLVAEPLTTATFLAQISWHCS